MDSACCSLKSVINRIKIQRVCLRDDDDDNGDGDDDDDIVAKDVKISTN